MGDRQIRACAKKELLVKIDELSALTQRMAYANIVVPLLMGGYNNLLKRQLEGLGVDYAHLDLTHGLDELKDYDLSFHLEAT